ncbi:MAG: amino acid adenylation domain-containing protein [Streptosporangiaceae bacterium]|nr:amino acid adenylation domain-containing protein [Streptosporangiaceae bacterium]
MAGPLFHETFLARAAESPDAVALTFENNNVTYGELASRSAGLARYLVSLGVTPETIVGISAEPSPGAIAGILGVLRAGGAYLPLDPAYPRQRLAYMVEDSGVALAIADAPVVLPGICEIDPSAAGEGPPPRVQLGPDNLAYVIYTSGSTGRPKGVMVSHRGLAGLIPALIEGWGLAPGARMLSFAPMSFDTSVAEIAVTLSAGATLVLARRNALVPGTEMVETLRAARVTHLILPPSVLAMLPYGPLPDLRTLICAGEALPPALADRWADGRRIVNGYGPTETTVCATYAEMRPGTGCSPIGRAIAGVHVTLVGPDLKPVPRGEIGQIAIGGDGVARGYLGQPARTAERFIADPYTDTPGARLYLTGDLARELPDSGFEFVGRIDHQVKLRGFRVEPDEVAAVLCEHSWVRNAVVIPSGQRLVAYAAGDMTAPATSEELLAFLAGRLPGYMTPAAVVLLGALPLTVNGKVDRTALPLPDRRSGGLAAAGTEPRTVAEQALVRIVGDLLDRSDIGVHDDFFALGGHSLLLGRLSARVRAEFGAELPIQQVYEASTVSAMAELITKAENHGPPPIRHVPRTGPVPLSYPQQRVWYLEELSPGNLAYNAQVTIRLRGPLSAKVLQDALTEIVRRHEILRSSFRAAPGGPVQEVRPPMPITVAVADLTGAPDDDAERLIRDTIQHPFDLARPPVARWLLIRHDPDDHTLVHVEHHFVHDGWSIALFLRELEAIYVAFSRGLPSPLPEPPVQYADFAIWQREWLRGDVLERQLDHWAGKLAGCPDTLDLLTDQPRPPVQSFRGDALRVDLPADLAERLRAFSRDHAVTLFVTMLAGFAALLYRYTGQDDMAIGTGFANRRMAETEQMIGMVVNTLALRADITGQPTFSELVRRIRQTVVDAQAWPDVPLERLVERLRPTRDPSRHPLFQVMFSFHDSPVPDLEFAGIHGIVRERHSSSAKADMNVVVVPRGEQRVGRAANPDDARITLIWEYCTDLFTRDTMSRMVAHYRTLLDAAVADPEIPIAWLPLLTGPQEAALVAGGTGRVARSAEPLIQVAIADRARERPSAIAIRDGHRVMTYADLDARATLIAANLQRHGVRPDHVAGVLLPRGTDLAAAQLGVLKAGAAYLPLDPDHPAGRLAYLCQDADPAVVVTTSRHVAQLPGGVPALLLEDLTADAKVSAVRVAPRNLAYVMYTSGSTGRPKGVMIEHAALAGFAAWYRREYSVARADRIAMVNAPGFDASVIDLWPALTAGASVHVVDEEVRLAPSRLQSWLQESRISLVFLTKALAEPLLDLPWPADTALRWLQTGGELFQRRPSPDRPFAVAVAYGPTEVTVAATAGRVDPAADPGDGRVQPAPDIGGPLPYVLGYVLDERLRPVPPGIRGELYVGGAGLARGYLRQPRLTAERFVPDPFATRPGGRLYRTGDLVRILPSGNLDFLGRADEQIKLRGNRVEPAEIEMALCRHPAIAQAYVMIRPDGPGGGKQLVGYFVTRHGHDLPGSDELRAHLERDLPRFMVPAAWLPLSRLPLGANGKIDASALPPPGESGGRAGGEPPATPLEHAVAEIWCAVLERSHVGVLDNFFDLGGHSMLIYLVRDRIEERLGRGLPIVEFFQYPTVRSLARHLGDGAPADDGAVADAGATARSGRLGGLQRLAARRARGTDGAGMR